MKYVKDIRKPDYSKTLVVDSHFMPRAIISSLRAFDIVYKGNAEIIYNHPETIGTVNKNVEYHRPSIIRIFKYVNINFHKAKLSRENVFLRDGYECVYCGENNRKLLTLDHVHPQSKGGKDTWENLVTACKSCNCEKDNLTILEYINFKNGVISEPNPKRPHYLMLVKKLNYIPNEWEDYLFLK